MASSYQMLMPQRSGVRHAFGNVQQAAYNNAYSGQLAQRDENRRRGFGAQTMRSPTFGPMTSATDQANAWRNYQQALYSGDPRMGGGGFVGGGGQGGGGGRYGGGGAVGTLGAGQGGGGQYGNALSRSYQNAYREAREANESRYRDILSRYDLRTTEGKTIQAENQNDLLGGYEGRYGRLIDRLEGLGDQELSDTNLRYDNMLAGDRQDLVSRGLTGSTISNNVTAGNERQRALALRRVNEGIQNQALTVDAQASLDSLRAQERAQDQRLQTGVGLEGDTLGFMERREDEYPDINQLIQLQRLQGASGLMGGLGYGGLNGYGGYGGGNRGVGGIPGAPVFMGGMFNQMGLGQQNYGYGGYGNNYGGYGGYRGYGNSGYPTPQQMMQFQMQQRQMRGNGPFLRNGWGWGGGGGGQGGGAGGVGGRAMGGGIGGGAGGVQAANPQQFFNGVPIGQRGGGRMGMFPPNLPGGGGPRPFGISGPMGGMTAGGGMGGGAGGAGGGGWSLGGMSDWFNFNNQGGGGGGGGLGQPRYPLGPPLTPMAPVQPNNLGGLSWDTLQILRRRMGERGIPPNKYFPNPR